MDGLEDDAGRRVDEGHREIDDEQHEEQEERDSTGRCPGLPAPVSSGWPRACERSGVNRHDPEERAQTRAGRGAGPKARGEQDEERHPKDGERHPGARG